MTRSEIEYLAASPIVAASRTENLSTRKPANEDKSVRCRYVEPLTIHLLFRQLYVLPDAINDGMTWFNDPQPLFIAGFTRLQIARCAISFLNIFEKCAECKSTSPMPSKTR